MGPLQPGDQALMLIPRRLFSAPAWDLGQVPEPSLIGFLIWKAEVVAWHLKSSSLRSAHRDQKSGWTWCCVLPQCLRWYYGVDWCSPCSLPLLSSSLLPTFATLLVALKTADNLLVLDSLPWRCRSAVACLVDGSTSSSLFYFLLLLTLCYQLGFSLSLTFHI